MNNVIDVADYIISYFNKKDKTITMLKLQQLLYFCQALYIKRLGANNLCFKDKILTSKYSPVIEKVLYENKYTFLDSGVIYYRYDTNIEHSDLIDTVCDKFLNTSVEELAHIIDNTPPYKKAQYNNGVIKIEDMCEYFTN